MRWGAILCSSAATGPGLRPDLGDLAGQLVSVSAITDPFGNYRPDDLAAAFPHLIAPFKEHFIVDLEHYPLDAASSHHRRYARRALRNLTVERSDWPDREAGSWQRLYASLVRRHGVTGIRAFSPAALEAQLEVPGAVLFKAQSDSHVVGMALWYVFGDVGYYHLGACSEAGYELRAFFGLFWRAIEYFAGAGLRMLGLGGGVGLAQSSDDGLSRFKRGWSTEDVSGLRLWSHSRTRGLRRTRQLQPGLKERDTSPPTDTGSSAKHACATG